MMYFEKFFQNKSKIMDTFLYFENTILYGRERSKAKNRYSKHFIPVYKQIIEDDDLYEFKEYFHYLKKGDLISIVYHILKSGSIEILNYIIDKNIINKDDKLKDYDNYLFMLTDYYNQRGNFRRPKDNIYKMIEILLEFGIDINTNSKRTGTFLVNSIIETTARQKDPFTYNPLKMLLKYKVNFNVYDIYYGTPLTRIVYLSKTNARKYNPFFLELFSLCIKNGGNPFRISNEYYCNNCYSSKILYKYLTLKSKWYGCFERLTIKGENIYKQGFKDIKFHLKYNDIK